MVWVSWSSEHISLHFYVRSERYFFPWMGKTLHVQAIWTANTFLKCSTWQQIHSCFESGSFKSDKSGLKNKEWKMSVAAASKTLGLVRVSTRKCLVVHRSLMSQAIKEYLPNSDSAKAFSQKWLRHLLLNHSWQRTSDRWAIQPTQRPVNSLSFKQFSVITTLFVSGGKMSSNPQW